MRRSLLAGALALAACAASDDRPRTWAYLYPAVVAPSCATATCHSALAARAGIVLDDQDNAYATLVDGTGTNQGPFVFPGDPVASPLVLILDGNERAQMPPEAPLPVIDRSLVADWIAAGAPR